MSCLSLFNEEKNNLELSKDFIAKRRIIKILHEGDNILSKNKIKIFQSATSRIKQTLSSKLHTMSMLNSYNNKNAASSILKSINQMHPSLKPIIKTDKRNNARRLKQKPILNNNGKTEYYTIQISSFENKKSAENLAKKMNLSGYPSKVTEAWVKGKIWFRVQHGEYKMIAVAKQVSNKIKNEFKFNPWISNIYK